MSAEQSLRQALRADPGNSVALAQLGQIYQESGQAPQAAAMYQQALAGNYNQPEVQSRLASLGPAARPAPGPQQMMAGYPPAGPQNGMGPMGPQYVMGRMGPQPVMNSRMLTATRGPATGPAMGAPSATFAPPTMGPPAMMNQQPMMAAWSPSPVMPSQPVMAAPTMAATPVSTITESSPPTTFSMPVPSSTLSTVVDHGPVLTVPGGASNWQPVQQVSGAESTQNADPAHVSDMTLSLPVVEPH